MATINGSASIRPSAGYHEEDTTRKQIHQLREKDGNNVCADCGAAGPGVE